ncbi:MAG: hypothetical protein FWE05_07515 [Defluviitaleaceae bacterium]|nr:hypothetical protein [Defluviitaleaceae bacterium]
MNARNFQFEGWYYKHQANGKSLSIIPGRSYDEAFVMVVTDGKSYYIPYPLSEYRKGDTLIVGGNIFSPDGITLAIHHETLVLTGEITYTNLTPIHGDIMGPFRFFPMECRHGIVSMLHTLHGEIILNGEVQCFTGGKGYIESDSGYSFPSGYTWVHSNDFEKNCSIMASVARIPFYGLKFWGCICVVWLNGQEYRLATYKGVKILRCEAGMIALKQGRYQLTITIPDPLVKHKLPAPRAGKMSHSIRESLSCPAHFRFMEDGHCLFDERSNTSSYEYEM